MTPDQPWATWHPETGLQMVGECLLIPMYAVRSVHVRHVDLFGGNGWAEWQITGASFPGRYPARPVFQVDPAHPALHPVLSMALDEAQRAGHHDTAAVLCRLLETMK